MTVNPFEAAAVPPPWRLTGSAYAIIYRFSESFVRERVTVPGALESRFAGGLGALLLVDYATSPVGPYRELAFTPGQFGVGGKAYCVTQIVVSSSASAASGRANWALPKEVADFHVDSAGGVAHWRVEQGGTLLLDARFRPGRLGLPLPRWLVRPKLAQPAGDHLLLTRFRVGGRVHLADAEAPVTGGLLPDLSRARPVGIVHLSRFNLTFPPAQSKPLAG